MAAGRKLTSRHVAVATLALVAAALLYRQLRPAPTATGEGTRPRGQSAAAGDLPRIDLGRLASPLPAGKAGRRDLFEFGAAPDEDEAPAEGSRVEAPPTPLPATPNPALVAAAAGPRLVAINLKFIGTLEQQGGIKVAVLLTDRNEILYGQVGQQVANRFKIVRIGFESVEVLDEGSGQSRRIPLKGN
jgi:hypothetical protein